MAAGAWLAGTAAAEGGAELELAAAAGRADRRDRRAGARRGLLAWRCWPRRPEPLDLLPDQLEGELAQPLLEPGNRSSDAVRGSERLALRSSPWSGVRSSGVSLLRPS